LYNLTINFYIISMKLLYKEKQFMQPIFTIINVVVILFLFYTILVYGSDYGTASLVVLGIILAIILFAVFNFAWLNIQVTDTFIAFRFGLFKKQFYIKNLVDVEIQKYDLKRFGGYGIRKSIKNETGFVARAGEGVYFRDKHSDKKIFLSTSKPEEVYTQLIENGALEKR